MFDLKKVCIVLTASLLAITASGQEFSFNMYFEDSLGNRDTLTLGYDSTATNGLDTVWGEQNIKDRPFDSVFEVRSFPCFIPCFREDHVSFLSEKQIMHSACDSQVKNIIGIGITCDECWPITVKWDSTLFQGKCRNNSFITDWRPGDWFDVLYGTEQGPFKLRNHDSLVLDYLTHSYGNDENDSNYLLFLGIADANSHFTGISKSGRDNSEFNIYPNPAKEVLNFEYPEGFAPDGQILIYNQVGQLALEQKANRKVKLNGLNKGLHVVQFIYKQEVLNNKLLIIQ